ncbi:hypothetical protein ACTZVH_14255 [Klebsiella pneumoniae]
MTKSTITREQLIKKAQEQIEFCRHTKITGEGRAHVHQCAALFEIALAAMNGEPVTWGNGCDKTVPAALRYLAENERPFGGESRFNAAHLYQLAREIELMAEAPLYRHAQQPVVPDDVLDALQKVARIRLDMNDFDGDRRGIADCLGDAEEVLIEVVNRRAAMLQAQSDDDGEPTDDERIMAIEGIHNCERCGDEGWVVSEMGITRCACGQTGNSPVIPDSSADMLRRWLAFGRGMQNAGSQLPHNLISETESILAPAPQEVK